MKLSSPVVVGPLSPHSKVVRVEGQLPNATIRILATSWSTGSAQTRVVGEEVVPSASADVTIAGAPLMHQDFVTAQQRKGSEMSDPLPPELGVEVWTNPTVDDLAGLFAPETLLKCARCLWVGGTEPGATVKLEISGEPPLIAKAVRDSVKFFLRPGKFLRTTDNLIISQTVPGLPGAAVSLPAVVDQAFPDAGTQAPIITEPLFRCQQLLYVENIIPGATVIVELDGIEHSSCFGYRTGWFRLPRPLDIGDELKVRQIFRLCERDSAFRNAFVTNRVPTPPVVIGPVCEGDSHVRLSGLVKDALVELALDGQQLCRGAAADVSMTFGVPSLAGGTVLTARQSLCGEATEDWSQWSKSCRIRPLGPQTVPTIVEPLTSGGVAVGVRGATRGAVVQLVGRRGVIGEVWANGDDRLDVRLWTALRFDDKVHSRTRRCGAVVDHMPEATVASRPSGHVQAPRVIDPACDCGGSVLVRNVVPGAIVEVFRAPASDRRLLGTGWAGDVTVSVDVPPLGVGDILGAAQRIGPQRSGLGPTATAPTLPHWDYVPHSAFRLSQLTQDADPTGRPHPGPTTQIGLFGTDLGVPVEHEGRLYLFFGDATTEGGDTDPAHDPIAWLTTSDPEDLEDRAPDLEWLTNENGVFHPLFLVGSGGMGLFEVPTGGFSYDGRLGVFIAYLKAENPSRMTASLLAYREPKFWRFHIDQFISTTVAEPHHVKDAQGNMHVSPPYKAKPGESTYVQGPGGALYKAPPWRAGNWLLHISPTVIHNADWPGVPSTTGDGLLMFGSSSYRGVPPIAADEAVNGNVYLAWAPIAPGVDRPVPTADNWRFFVGMGNFGKPVWRTMAEMKAESHPGWRAPRAILPSTPTPRILGELSVVWYPQLRRWILAGGEQAEINVARKPWGPWSTSEIICHAAKPDRDASNQTVPWTTNASAYAPYLIGRWMRWDRSTRRATLYFTLSGFDDSPGKAKYQPHLIRSSITCNPPT